MWLKRYSKSGLGLVRPIFDPIGYRLGIGFSTLGQPWHFGIFCDPGDWGLTACIIAHGAEHVNPYRFVVKWQQTDPH